jgi:CHAT domain-containing protein
MNNDGFPLVSRYLELARTVDPARPAPAVAGNETLPLDEALLDRLVETAAEIALNQPRLAWSLMSLASTAATQTGELRLQALSAWNLARVANEWVRPDRVGTAISQARDYFTQLADPAWLAACDWQLNALAWTRPNFQDAAGALAAALQVLEQSPLASFAPLCRLDLAFARLLTGQFESVPELIARSEADLAGTDHEWQVAFCRLVEAGLHRRQAEFDEAFRCLDEASALFAARNGAIGILKADYQRAVCHILLGADSQTTTLNFIRLAEAFQQHDLPLWAAQCYSGAGQTYRRLGELGQSLRYLGLARREFIFYDIRGLLADNLLDTGSIESDMGHSFSSLELYAQAKAFYQQSNAWVMVAIADLYQGSSNLQLGRHQLALHHAESAYRQLLQLSDRGRLAECQQLLARIWLDLGLPANAESYLAEAVAFHEQTQQTANLILNKQQLASVLLAKAEDEQALRYLHSALELAQQHEMRPQVALCRRLIGQALLRRDDLEAALTYLTAAESDFAAMKMVFDRAVTQVALADCYHCLSQQTQNVAPDQAEKWRLAARKLWYSALNSSGLIPSEIHWQAYAGLAQLAEASGKKAVALKHYRLMIQSVAEMRQSLDQADLIDAYLQRPQPALERAMLFAATTGYHHDLLQFIEVSKAQNVARRIQDGGQATPGRLPAGLGSLGREVRALQRQLRTSLRRGQRLLDPEQASTAQVLRQKEQEFGQQLKQFEREQPYQKNSKNYAFDIEQFRHLTTAALGSHWIALDYHLTDDHLICLALTNDRCESWVHTMTGSIMMALHTWARFEGRRQPPQAQQQNEIDMDLLGQWLLPEKVQARLTPDTYLIIAPNGRLHHLPWPALRTKAAGSFLVEQCIPVIIPSLHTLSLLCQRSIAAPALRRNGLVVAVSEFQGRHEALPAVREEVSLLRQRLGPGSRVLLDEQATWPNVRAAAGAQGLAHFGFLHLASHISPDPASGRLTNIALSDDDIWPDSLWRLAPLPPLVTLSTCSGSHKRVYMGDEQVGLVTTCLAANAVGVVGNLWPVADGVSARLLVDFYDNYFAGQNGAAALAGMQRQAIARAEPLPDWSGFIYNGRP